MRKPKWSLVDLFSGRISVSCSSDSPNPNSKAVPGIRIRQSVSLQQTSQGGGRRTMRGQARTPRTVELLCDGLMGFALATRLQELSLVVGWYYPALQARCKHGIHMKTSSSTTSTCQYRSTYCKGGQLYSCFSGNGAQTAPNKFCTVIFFCNAHAEVCACACVCVCACACVCVHVCVLIK